MHGMVMCAEDQALRAIYFIDDWMLDRRCDVDRVFPLPRQVKLQGVEDMGVSTIIYDPVVKRFRAWSKLLNTELPARLHESEDGVAWHPTGHTRQMFPRQNFFEQTWFYDPWDSDPARRHKMITWPYKQNTYGGPGLIETAPDGINWKLQREWAWSPPEGNGSDTNNNIFYNPFMREYAVVCRKHHIDRRIAVVVSRDLKNWSLPRIMLQPEPSDQPLTQFYGMGVFLYKNEIFLGFPLVYRVPDQESRIDGNVFYKMSGRVQSELAYSYDASAWNRTTRQPVIPLNEPGEHGGGGSYVRALAQRPADGQLLIYSRGVLTNHDGGRRDAKPENIPQSGLLLHVWREDGFAALDAISNTSMIRTRYLVPHSPELTLNLQAPFGEAWVQVVDKNNAPAPGFTFNDCVPLTGDDAHMPVRWRKHADLKAVMDGNRIAIEIRFSSARLYAVNLHCSPWYTNTKRPVPRP